MNVMAEGNVNVNDDNGDVPRNHQHPILDIRKDETGDGKAIVTLDEPFDPNDDDAALDAEIEAILEEDEITMASETGETGLCTKFMLRFFRDHNIGQ